MIPSAIFFFPHFALLYPRMDFESFRRRLNAGEIPGEQEVARIFAKLEEILTLEENIVRVPSPVVICGDVHGQYEDVILLLSLGGDPKHTNYLFMGDYVDRGYYSLNTFLLLATYKIEHPLAFFLLRGNHETRQVTQQYGFQVEIRTKYGHTGLWTCCMKLFDLLPMAAVTEAPSGRIFSVHGGLSPDLVYFSEINDRDRKRELPEDGPLTDIAWSDPSEGVADWRPNSRGAGYLFGHQAVARFARLNRVRLITRSHQLAEEGFVWYFPSPDNHERKSLINVWSAPNYGYSSGNKASLLRVGFDGREELELRQFSAAPVRIARDKEIADPQSYFA
jgi:diadenosine tetraphosphatase ApaH/serine/threonine PP2A family protein phosphatase